MGGRVLDRDGRPALRRTAIALMAGAAGALMAPSGLLAADSPAMTPATGTPVAALTATPIPATAGKPVRLDASRSSDPGGAIVHYTWDLDGNGSYETDSGAHPFATARFAAPGPARVGLRVVDARGATAESRLVVKVVARPRPQSRPSPDSAGEPAARASGPGPTVPGPDAGGAAPDPSRRPVSHRPARIRAAASGGVSIKSFAFHPGTTNVKVGDSVTWTNQDSVSHTATANDGSFNTGVLKQGQSGSHTFTTAGTFAYICAIHPNMHGTIVVTGASAGGSSSNGGGSGSGGSGGASPAGSAGSGSAAAPSSGSGGASSGSSLPHTGLELIWILALGGAMTGGGAVLRRLSRR